MVSESKGALHANRSMSIEELAELKERVSNTLQNRIEARQKELQQ
jgi:hypothetical protein